MDTTRPERMAALDYLRRKGTEAPVSKLQAGLRTAFERFERAIEGVPESRRTARPTPAAWSVQEIVDHLVQTNRPALAEVRALLAGVVPSGGPVPARLTSPNARGLSWDALTADLKGVHAGLLEAVSGATDERPLPVVKAPFTMVVKVSGECGTDVLEWVDELDWKAYVQALRIHTHEHLAQVERTLTALG
jgi:hypothetical protein